MSDDRPDSPDWLAALFHGNAGEKALAKWFWRRGCEVLKLLEPFKDYDLLVQSRVEVKNDVAALTTGNVAVEVSYRGEPSGIMATRSTLWAILIGGEAILIPTRRLRDFILDNPFPQRPAGDDGKAVVKLVPIATLRKQPFVRVIRLEGGL